MRERRAPVTSLETRPDPRWPPRGGHWSRPSTAGDCRTARTAVRWREGRRRPDRLPGRKGGFSHPDDYLEAPSTAPITWRRPLGRRLLGGGPSGPTIAVRRVIRLRRISRRAQMYYITEIRGVTFLGLNLGINEEFRILIRNSELLHFPAAASRKKAQCSLERVGFSGISNPGKACQE